MMTGLSDEGNQPLVEIESAEVEAAVITENVIEFSDEVAEVADVDNVDDGEILKGKSIKPIIIIIKIV